MEWVLVSLTGFGVLLLLVSFFVNDEGKETKEEIDELSLQMMGDVYEMKKRLSFLEEELLTVQTTHTSTPRQSGSTKLRQEAYQLFEQGLELETIAKKMNLTTNEVKSLLGGLSSDR
ncbi:hypothetical protein [Alteribacillus iranensis]|uniref:Helix-turn-helix domain of resolvase n=1 Tax=Alteribacillus iranensis TaxID=930128 RepID=A0A1I1ZDN6_9BACI|nr:hypothetical protein [Alteribacillus iranensis]SFE29846.1 hypothetical protein SAMN05192532_101186 [Alteribacillus iranensis]